MSDIDYNSIPAAGLLYVPGQYIEFNDALAAAATAGQPHRILVIGQMLPPATTPLGQLTPVPNSYSAAVLFGPGSMLTRMLHRVFMNQTGIPVDAVAVPEGPVAATQTVTITGVATAAGELPFYVCGIPLGIPVAAGETAAQVAAALAAEFPAVSGWPVAAVANGGVVTFSAKNLGLAGADIDLRTVYLPGDAIPPGLAVAIAPGANGTANPDITAALTAASAVWYDTIVMPFSDPGNLLVLSAELNARWAPPRQTDSRAYFAKRGSQGALAAFGATQNNLSLVCFEATGPTTPYERAAFVAGAIAQATAADPARPVGTLVLNGDRAPAPAERFQFAQRNALLMDGISTTVVDAGGNVLIERAVTMYLTNAEGAADRAYLDVMTPITLSYLRWSERNLIATLFPRYKLADDGTPISPGQAIVTPKTIKSALVAHATTDWQAKGLVENVADYSARLVVQRNSTDRKRLDVLSSPTLVGGLLIYCDQIQFQE